ncbi:MAG: TM0996/MTH895 family glutaredoxin-like protein [Bacteroidales bacterium]|nr:MAG: TM0996/MTH895 family glutaredoxin-like protein [Bacteroidales bacterium]
MEIKVLGTGCPRCKALEREVFNALAELDIAANVSKVEDIMKIMEYGIMHTPGLVINGKVVLSGRLPSRNELKQILTQNQ